MQEVLSWGAKLHAQKCKPGSRSRVHKSKSTAQAASREDVPVVMVPLQFPPGEVAGGVIECWVAAWRQGDKNEHGMDDLMKHIDVDSCKRVA